MALMMTYLLRLPRVLGGGGKRTSLGDDANNNRRVTKEDTDSNNVFIIFEVFKDDYGDNDNDIIKFESYNRESINKKDYYRWII